MLYEVITGADMPELTYEEATPLFELPPGDRGYGGGKIITADEQYVKERTVDSPVTRIGKK